MSWYQGWSIGRMEGDGIGRTLIEAIDSVIPSTCLITKAINVIAAKLKCETRYNYCS